MQVQIKNKTFFTAFASSDCTHERRGFYIEIRMGNIKDVTGEKYHMLTITGLAPYKKEPSGKSVKRVYTVCECGNKSEASYKNLKRGKIKSCGCLSENVKRKVEPGQKFTHWTAIEEAKGYFKNGEKEARTFLCRCVCGKEKEVNLDSLYKGQSKSCGCQGREKKIKEEKIKRVPEDTEKEQWKQSVTYPNYYISTSGNLFNYRKQYLFPFKTHHTINHNQKEVSLSIVKEVYKTFIGEYDESIFVVQSISLEIKLENLELIHKEKRRLIGNVYGAIKNRCDNKNSPDYKNYGGRGICVEESFSNVGKFYTWAINNGYEKGLEIDRENNDGNYSDTNCRWVTKAENTRNRRASVMNWELVEKIRYGEWKYFSPQTLAKMVGCHQSTIENVRNFKTWVA